MKINIKNILLATAITFAIIFAFITSVEADEPEMVIYDFEITRVIDGDTVAFKADFLPAPLKQELSIRVYGVDTPEKSWRAECDQEALWGEEASQFTKDKLNSATTIQVAIYKWDKYGGRVLGDIIIDGKSLRYMLIENGFAREYYGDAKESWC
jgi:endonuclease YncB( thermonuclease family)|tara:strand:+ start:794 stop:1255 length:462 start_codon:yes stop_codon:yes gene_type:complete